MSNTTYTIEHAKSSRSSCKRCKQSVGKGETRLGVHVQREDQDFSMTSWYHPQCFKLPKKLAQNMTSEDFVQDLLEDPNQDCLTTEEERASLAALLGSGPSKKKEADGESHGGILGIFQQEHQRRQESDKKPNSKKMKLDPDFESMYEVYAEHVKEKADHLKEILRWNKQVLTGTKPMLLYKVMDGQTRGRLGPCPLDGGRLKLVQDENNSSVVQVQCNGVFDEDTQMRMPCGFSCPPDDPKCPRQTESAIPWFIQEPSTEEEKQILADEEAAAKEFREGTDAVTDSDHVKKVLKDAKIALGDQKWDWQDKKSFKEKAKQIVKFCREHHVDIPDDDKLAQMKIGKLILGESAVEDKPSLESLMKAVIKTFGLAPDKAVQQQRKDAAAEAACVNPKNARIVLAFTELAQFYFKEGNRNAGATYTKAANAIKELDMEVTAGNAMSLSKGKTKVANIGKSSAEKMKELLETGTMQKLEEKRAAHA